VSLKIISGRFRSRLLKTPKGEKTRPTLAVMRKAVFDILQSEIEDACFLDLYAGSGAMGLEALSRGASHATFVESHRPAFCCIEENTRQLDVQKSCTLISYDTRLALKKMARDGQSFDIAYADPPYAPAAKLKLLQEILLFFDTHSLLHPGGKLFLEEAFPPILKPDLLPLNTLRHVDTRTFSRSTLHQFQKV
jgi:16S rRNA (guanine(966)-N(2))-methyltransferase RsmD